MSTKLIIALTSYIFTAAAALAADDAYQHAGIVDAVYPQENRVVVDDRSYPIASYAIIRSGGTRIELQSLPLNKPVGYNVDTSAGRNARGIITEMEVLDKLPDSRGLDN